MKAAVIENGFVTHLWEVPTLDCYGDLYVLVEAHDGVKLGAAWDGQKFANPINPQIKADMWEAIKAERDRRKSGGFNVRVGSGNKWFHGDADSRIQHLGLKDKARDLIAGGGAMTDKLTILGQTVRWKTMDGSFVDVSAQIAFDIVAAAGDLDAQLFAAAETHKAAMEASADPSAYDVSGGWPATFAG